MITTNFYIERISDGLYLQAIGESKTWDSFPPSNAMVFSSYQDAENYIDANLDADEYRIESKIVKT